MSGRLLRERRSRRFAVGGKPIDVRVRESRRGRTTRLTVRPQQQLDIVVPRRVTGAEIDRFLESNRDWIERKLAEARELAARPPQLRLERPGTAWLGGVPLPLERLDGRRAVAEVRHGRLRIAGPDESAPAALERWYRREARMRISAAANREAARLDLEFGSIGIRERTRWGSCSSRGNLSFSWRLVVAPPEVLEYVVVHELLHLREANHSRAFWHLLEAARPGWRRDAGWLREHGRELSDYRPAAALSR